MLYEVIPPGGASLHNCMVPHGPDTEGADLGIDEVGAMRRTRHPLLEGRFHRLGRGDVLHGAPLCVPANRRR